MSLDLLAPQTTVRDIAARLPGAAQIFRDADISFCCGGALTLPEAAEKAGLELGGLVAELQDLITRAAQEAPSETPDLIAYILKRYHETHREELNFLVQLANRVETVHGDHEEAPLGLTGVLLALRDDLDGHMTKEETVLFPAMLGGATAMLAVPIGAMQEEHAATSDLLRKVEHITHGLSLPEGACGSWTALYTGLRKLCEDVVAHIHLEETVLFPRALAA